MNLKRTKVIFTDRKKRRMNENMEISRIAEMKINNLKKEQNESKI